MTEHICDGQWRYYCEACSGLPNDPDLIKEWKREGSPFRLTPEEWETKREEASAAQWDRHGKPGLFAYAPEHVRRAFHKDTDAAMTALGFERTSDDR